MCSQSCSSPRLLRRWYLRSHHFIFEMRLHIIHSSNTMSSPQEWMYSHPDLIEGPPSRRSSTGTIACGTLDDASADCSSSNSPVAAAPRRPRHDLDRLWAIQEMAPILSDADYDADDEALARPEGRVSSSAVLGPLRAAYSAFREAQRTPNPSPSHEAQTPQFSSGMPGIAESHSERSRGIRGAAARSQNREAGSRQQGSQLASFDKPEVELTWLVRLDK